MFPSKVQTNFFFFFQSPFSSSAPEMNHIISFSIFKKPPLLPLQIIPFLLLIIFFSEAQSISWNSSSCAPHDCGNGLLLEYPFWITGLQEPNCGSPYLNTTCKDKNPILKLSGDDYIIKQINYIDNSVLLVQHEAFDQDNNCPLPRFNFSVQGTPFKYNSETTDLYFYYNCTMPYERGYTVDCAGNNSFAVFLTPRLDTNLNERCQAPINLPVWSDNMDKLLHMNYSETLKVGFVLLWDGVDCENCKNIGGHCGSNDNGDFACFCNDHVCGHGSNMRLKIGIGVGAAGGTAVVVLCLIFFVMTFRFSWKRKETQEVDAVIKKFGSSTPRRYSYAEIKKMTKSFKNELGKGGYGVVYKGYLTNGNPVAVKLLNPTKGNGEEFVNEVVSISRTSHVNVVSLLGFCFDGRNRAVIYEFMPNGSLEKHIRNKSDTHMGLDLEGLYKIAIGVARGLEYLHGGCNTRILHFDIKPHNILLDEDLLPKISDFGLAKLGNGKESIVSMLEARGTIGYIAPEVFNRCFGVVSYKSDVYSYGMMLLEIVGARNKPTKTIEISNSSDTYFPDWAYQRVTCNEDQNLQADAMGKEDEVERKMILVGLWCIQTNPSYRPSMSKVIDMLEGSLDGLQIPPKTILHSPSIAERASLEASMMASGTTFSLENI